jgi:hypothetical protein
MNSPTVFMFFQTLFMNFLKNYCEKSSKSLFNRLINLRAEKLITND